MRLYISLLLGFIIIFLSRVSSIQQVKETLTPQSIYRLTLDIRFEQDNDVINIETFIPQDDERQQIIQESFVNNGLGYLVTEDEKGRTLQWSGQANLDAVQYKALLKSSEVIYQIDENLTIPKNYPVSVQQFLQETPAIQIFHPEINLQWQRIKPKNTSNILAVLQAIYNYTYLDIESVSFKGHTDALTALRLKQASCNGKSRLFVALARMNNIPSRLVGGIILNEGSKKTTHQWVEAYVEGHWIPFGPTNGNFARLPANYLKLYRTDQVLFKYTSDINFNYLFSINNRLVAPSLYQLGAADNNQSKENSEINLTRLLLLMGLAPETIGLFLLFPLCTLIITFLRNIIGVKTFGVFMPMLIAAACVFTGFLKGIFAFVIILLVSYLSHLIFNQMRMLKVARLAAIITINTVFFIAGLSIIGTQSQIEFGMLSLFPVVIISFIAERVHHLTEEHDWKGLFFISAGTLISIWFCYVILRSFLLEGLFSYYPEFYLLVLASLLYIGQWTGLRLSELHRFRSILGDALNPVLGINSRNRDLVYQHNANALLQLAADKLASKEKLKAQSISIPETLLVIDSFSKLNLLDDFLAHHEKFALKPNQGSQGNGIIIIVGKDKQGFISASGKPVSIEMIHRRCLEIISGTFSQSGDNDIAYFEPLLVQHQSLQTLAPYGLSDIRVILSKGKIVSAMLRMPTLASDGKANLHQGAVGIAIDINSGKTISAKLKQGVITRHPDSDSELLNINLPCWDEIILMSKRCYEAIPLGYLGVDICIDQQIGPLVLEVNGRPGIEIQNIQNRGLYADYIS